jgi:hypothetical protein
MPMPAQTPKLASLQRLQVWTRQLPHCHTMQLQVLDVVVFLTMARNLRVRQREDVIVR